MKKLILILFSGLLTFPLSAQGDFDRLMDNGFIQKDAGNFAKAAEYFENAASIENTSDMAMAEAANALCHSGEWSRAIEYCDYILKRNFDFQHVAYHVKGVCQLMLGDKDEAYKTLTKGVRNYNRYTPLVYDYGLVAALKGKFTNAARGIAETALKYTTESTPHLALGDLMYSYGYYAESAACYYYGLMLNPVHPNAAGFHNRLLDALVKMSDRNNPPKLDFKPVNHKGDDIQLTDFLLLGSRMSQDMSAGEAIPDISGTQYKEFVTTTYAYFNQVAAYKSYKRNNGWADLWERIYSKKLYSIMNSDFSGVFCNYIQAGVVPAADEWVRENDDIVTAFKNLFLNSIYYRPFTPSQIRIQDILDSRKPF